MTQASICTIGDEILIGQIVDTNSSHISRMLNSSGIKVTRMLSIGDESSTELIVSKNCSSFISSLSSLSCFTKIYHGIFFNTKGIAIPIKTMKKTKNKAEL